MRMSELDKEEASSIRASLEQFSRDMTAKHTSLLSSKHADIVRPQPPIRAAHKENNITVTSTATATAAPTSASQPAPSSQSAPSKRIPGHDFRAWDKFDVDSALKELDDATQPAPQPAPPTAAAPVRSTPRSLPPATIANIPASASEREALARAEKDKGNECYQAGDVEEAIVYYSRSLSVLETSAALNNRALAHLRLKQHTSAAADCTRVLALEPGNSKALIRRATAYRSLKDYAAARADIDIVLKKEPNNKDALSVLKDMPEAKVGAAPSTSQPVVQAASSTTTAEPKRRRLVIEEVDDDEDESAPAVPATQPHIVNEPEKTPTTSAPTTITSQAPAQASPVASEHVAISVCATPAMAEITEPTVQAAVAKPTPPRVDDAKEKGNKVFAAGDYVLAQQHYTHALTRLAEEPDAADHAVLHASLLSNRAACHLKLGDATSTLTDCNLSLQLDPSNLKSLLRRASAYEMRERYQSALDDYRAVLLAHPGNKAALDGVNRTSRAVRSLGPDAPKPAITPISASTTGAQVKPTPSKTEQYEMWKGRGNEYVKQENYIKAIECYNQCVLIDASVAFALNNRAHCHLKLNNHTAAVVDATAVLAIEPQNIKAMYRRAQAHVAMQHWQEAKSDLDNILAIDPSNAAAKVELAKVAPLVPVIASAPKAEPKRRVQIEEIEDEPDASTKQPKTTDTQPPTPVSPVTTSTASKAAQAKPTTSPAKPIVVPDKAPTTPLEFIRLFATFKHNPEALAAVLKLVKPADLPKLFSNQLEADHLAAAVRAYGHVSFQSDPALSEHVVSLTKVARFDLAKMLLDDDDLGYVRGLIAHIATADGAKAKLIESKFF